MWTVAISKLGNSLKLGIHDLRVALKVLQQGSVVSLSNSGAADSSLDLLKHEGKVEVTVYFISLYLNNHKEPRVETLVGIVNILWWVYGLGQANCGFSSFSLLMCNEDF